MRCHCFAMFYARCWLRLPSPGLQAVRLTARLRSACCASRCCPCTGASPHLGKAACRKALHNFVSCEEGQQSALRGSALGTSSTAQCGAAGGQHRAAALCSAPVSGPPAASNGLLVAPRCSRSPACALPAAGAALLPCSSRPRCAFLASLCSLIAGVEVQHSFLSPPGCPRQLSLGFLSDEV